MTYSYIAYIDESGDDGLRKLRTRKETGSSTWFVISCCVARYIYRQEFVKWRDQIAALMPNKKKRDIHFRELNHSQKLMAAQNIAKFPIRGVSVLSNKMTIGSGIYKEKNQFYHYVTRHVIERMSWLCRDMRQIVPEGDGRVKIVFSRRLSMNYDDFRDYLRHLKNSTEGSNGTSIYWPVIDIDGVDAQDHSKDAGLQIADCIASACYSAVEPDQYWNYEDRYARALKRIMYERNGNYSSYGLKTLPHISAMNLSEEQKAFFDFYYT